MLQYVLHDEGRIVADNSPGAPRPWEYQYFLKDHLGNVRVTFSEKTTTTEIKATLENNTQTSEQNTFRNYGNRSGFTLFNHTPAGTYSQLLNASSNSQVGLAKSYAVNPGDIFDMEVYVKYEAPTSTGTNLSGFFAALASAFSLNPAGGTGLEGQQAYNAFNAKFGAGPVNGTGPWDDSMAPRAYLNYILFDQNFAFVDMGWQQVSTAAKQVGATPVVPHEYLSLHVKVQQAGYLYVYLSNETPQMTNVYFDDFQIRYTTAVEQVASYYPFGLSQRSNGFERASAIKNPLLFNGKEIQDELSLGWMDFESRMFDVTLGRTLTMDEHADSYEDMSPYSFLANNPVSMIDPTGMDFMDFGAGGEMLSEAQCETCPKPGLPDVTLSAVTITSTRTAAPAVPLPNLGKIFTDFLQAMSKVFAAPTSATMGTLTTVLVAIPVAGAGEGEAELLAKMWADRNALWKARKKIDQEARPEDPKPEDLPWKKGESPGPDWKWEGKGTAESGKGNWVNQKTGQKLHPDLSHGPPKGPHWGLKRPDGTHRDIFPPN